jgi:hypothetical protein
MPRPLSPESVIRNDRHIPPPVWLVGLHCLTSQQIHEMGFNIEVVHLIRSVN